MKRFFSLFLLPSSLLAAPSYNRDVRPILSSNCFACHGADAKHREADLRLDTQEGAHGEGESGDLAIVPGDPDASAIWQRINTTDLDDLMPPSDSHKTITAEQKKPCACGSRLARSTKSTGPSSRQIRPPSRPAMQSIRSIALSKNDLLKKSWLRPPKLIAKPYYAVSPSTSPACQRHQMN